jgi:hypothetical protein
VISSAARSRRSQSQSQVAGTRIQHTNTNRTNTGTNRTGRITNRTGAGTNRTARRIAQAREHVHRSRSRQSQLQGTGAGTGTQSTGAGQGQGQEQAYGTGHRSRRGGHDTIRHDTTRYDTDTYDTITHDTRETHETGSRSRIRYACERITNHVRYARHAWHSAAAQHSRQTDARHTAARIRTVNSQTVSGSHGKRQTVSGICKKRPGGGVNWIHFPFGG